MNYKRSFLTIAILFMIPLFVIGLTSCKLPASTGPESNPTTSDGFPIPGESEPATSVIDLSIFATQTARASTQIEATPIVITPIAPYPSPATPIQAATKVPTVTATPTSIAYVTATPGGPPPTYVLQEGEYPFCIARRFNVSETELLSLNNLTPDSFFYAGEELKIPQTGNPFEGTRRLHDHPTTYTVVSGDTLGSIACYFGDVSPDMIKLQNDLSSDTLKPGTDLIIP